MEKIEKKITEVIEESDKKSIFELKEGLVFIMSDYHCENDKYYIICSPKSKDKLEKMWKK